MTTEPINPPARHIRCWRILRRILVTLLGAMLIGWAMHVALTALDHGDGPAGFGRGVLQGAMMPGTLPNLLLGKDTVIYAQNNTGVPYKLGYTAGVNGCGLFFFGYFFWRLNRWRKGLQSLGRD